jgi:hypothetical protein
MGRIFSLHEYDLRPGVPPLDFERALRDGAASGLLEIPGLAAFRLGRGVKGARLGLHAALWIYESRAAWEQIWGLADRPLPPQEYPPGWRKWEQVLSPFLATPPDAIRFTTYEEIGR